VYGVIIAPITNDSSVETVESYGQIIDMDTATDEGFSRDFCDGQTSPFPPRWADDQAGMLYTYSEGAARSFSDILRADLTSRITAGEVAFNPTWITAGRAAVSAIVTEELTETVLTYAPEYITESQIHTAINAAIAEGATTEAEIIEWIRLNRGWYA
jgi:hypothetical protein